MVSLALAASMLAGETATVSFAKTVDGTENEDSVVVSDEELATVGDAEIDESMYGLYVPAGGLQDFNYSDIEYNYAKLLQYSLYLYDGNMCGTNVSSRGKLDWRGNCHTYDKTTYKRKDGVTVNVDLTGGFHDAGDAVKFGLPEAYSAFVLGMSYDTYKDSFEKAGQVGHLKDITTHFADYFVNCTVLDASGNVETFCCQVGQGGGGYDHGYWGPPEQQPNQNRPIYFTSANEPSTDIVSLSAAALAMQYKNFGGDNYLSTAKKLFEYAKKNNKATNRTAGQFYSSSAWQDDYCLAALMLYKVTGDGSYKSEFDRYASDGNAQKGYWPLCWDNVGPAVAYYNGRSSSLNDVMNVNGNTTYGGYKCIDDWGSARLNTSVQYCGLLYDKMTNSNKYRGFAEGQMKYLLGNNAVKQCYVIGYNNYGPKYPHHRAASGYTGSVQGTKQQAHVLLGALVGGQQRNGFYEDTANNYQTNEVAIDYNATLVAAAAAIYSTHTNEANQTPDPKYYVDDPSKLPGAKLTTNGLYVMENDRNHILVGMVTNYAASKLEYRWLACDTSTDSAWFEVSPWTKGNEWLDWAPSSSGDYVIVCEARVADKPEEQVSANVGVNHHKYIKGICQMPYTGKGGGYLIGFESYDNPGQKYSYEMLILDCTLLAQNLPAWTYTTGQCRVSSGNALWTVWQPQYGYYWTLFRLFDENGNMLDQRCYPFVNAY